MKEPKTYRVWDCKTCNDWIIEDYNVAITHLKMHKKELGRKDPISDFFIPTDRFCTIGVKESG